MTYLEVVNKVLIRLREDTVTSITDTEYSRLVAEFVNDAISQIEDSWSWSALRTTVTVNTQEDIFNYNLTGFGNGSTILDVINDTSNFFMEYRTQSWFNDKYLNNTIDSGAPRYYTFNGVNENGDTAVDIYPPPEGAYALRFNVVMRAGGLSNDSDQILVPTLPVIHLAQAMAVRERGESGAQSTPELFYTAERTLSDAISLDASKHPEETIFYVG